jgi:hypothetical protein
LFRDLAIVVPSCIRVRGFGRRGRVEQAYARGLGCPGVAVAGKGVSAVKQLGHGLRIKDAAGALVHVVGDRGQTEVHAVPPAGRVRLPEVSDGVRLD